MKKLMQGYWKSWYKGNSGNCKHRLSIRDHRYRKKTRVNDQTLGNRFIGQKKNKGLVLKKKQGGIVTK